MYREWQIKGENPQNCETNNPTKKSRQCYLINKATKRVRIATIVGLRITDGISAPFYGEETRKREVTMTRRIAHSMDTATTAGRKVTPRRNVGSNIHT